MLKKGYFLISAHFLQLINSVILASTEPLTSAKHGTAARLKMWIWRGYCTKARNNRAEPVSFVPNQKLINNVPDVKGRVPNCSSFFFLSFSFFLTKGTVNYRINIKLVQPRCFQHRWSPTTTQVCRNTDRWLLCACVCVKIHTIHNSVLF